MKLISKLLVASLTLHSLSAMGGVFENWTSPFLSAAGTYYSESATNVTDPSKRWLVNSWQAACLNNLPGPNPCYAPSSGRLYFHGTFGGDVGHGVLLVSKDKIAITNGLIVEGGFRAYCTTSVGGCWVNLGIYRGEDNYRAIGFKSLGNGVAHFNIWGPDKESTFDGGRFVNLPLTGSLHHYKLQYWNNNGTWRWDFFLDNTWVAGHNVPDNEHRLGPAQFGDARIELGFGGYQIGNASAEGYFESITYAVW